MWGAELLESVAPLSGWPRVALILAAASFSALVLYEDFGDMTIPKWVFYFGVFLAAVFWVAVLPVQFHYVWVAVLPVQFHYVWVFAAFVIFYVVACFAAFPLMMLGLLVDIGHGDHVYAGVLGTLLPSPLLWGSPCPYIPSTFGAMPVDYVINVALAYTASWAVVNAYARLKGEGITFPYSPVVALVFALTVLFGAWWRPVVLPIIEILV